MTAHGMTPELVRCATLKEWRTWLSRNHGKSGSIWLVFLKGAAPKQALTYDDALDEALCYGWIDSLIRRIDARTYARMFSRRREESKWSSANKARVKRLTAEDRMKPAGTAIVRTAKANGMWDKPDRLPLETRVPRALEGALRMNRKADACFRKLPPSHRQRYIMWIATAKKEETVARRVAEAIRLLEDNRPLGLK